MRVPRPLTLALFAVGIACGDTAPARDQWLVRIETDAPVPLLGDQLLVSVLGPDGGPYCSSCQRIFSVSKASDFPISFGILQQGSAPGAAPLVRARLFRSRNQPADGFPLPELAIDSLGRLPLAQGVTKITLGLPSACIGVAADESRALSCNAADRQLAPAKVLRDETFATAGTWPEGLDEPCPEAPPSGMVCVPGGLFALGESNGNPFFLTIEDLESGVRPERLVRLSPFAIDATETTVAQYDSLVSKDAVGPRGLLCAAELDADRPANCVSFTDATAACVARGLRLPTEAEFEYVAGNRGLETPFPWGHNPDVCAFATIARGGTSQECAVNNGRILERRASAVATGKDQTLSGLGTAVSGPVFDLAGNLGEWVLDDGASYDAPCRTAELVQRDPLCRIEASGARRITRGGSYASPTINAHVYARNAADSRRAPDVGFRCVKSYGAAGLR